MLQPSLSDSIHRGDWRVPYRYLTIAHAYASTEFCLLMPYRIGEKLEKTGEKWYNIKNGRE